MIRMSDREKELLAIIEARDMRIMALKTALRDALSTFREDGRETLVTTERQEAWRAALTSGGKFREDATL